MRTITEAGWARILEGFSDDAPIGNAAVFWAWASQEGSAFQLAAWFILASADACAEDFSGVSRVRWTRTKKEASPLRLARALDGTRRACIADFIVNAKTMVY